MKKILALCVLPIGLGSCSSDTSPLSESECKTIAEKEAVHLASRFNQHPEMMASILRLADSRAEQCISGDAFDRDDFECVARASDGSDMDTCLENAAKKSS